MPELWSRHEHRAAADMADGCFSALAELLAPQHGAVRETAALALRPLAPGLLSSGTAGGAGKASSRGGASAGGRAGAAIRVRILAFAEEALRCEYRGAYAARLQLDFQVPSVVTF